MGMSRWSWLLVAAVWWAAPAHAAPERVVHIYVSGALPGVSDQQAPRLVAGVIAALQMPGWRFVAADSAAAADRMVWHVTPLPYAVSDLARMGRSLKPLQDLFGRHRYFKVEVRLFLDGIYQTEAFATVEIQDARTDTHVPAMVASLVRPMMTMGLHPEMTPPARWP
jgi:hypothetical protein